MEERNRAKYLLTTCPGKQLQGPSDAEIRDAVLSRPGGKPSFVILDRATHHFMQAAGSSADGFQLECQEYSTHGHWEHRDSGSVDADTVIRALTLFAVDDERWRTDFPWRRLDVEAKRHQADLDEIRSWITKSVTALKDFLGKFQGKRK